MDEEKDNLNSHGIKTLRCPNHYYTLEAIMRRNPK